MYDKTENVEKTAKKIVANMNSMAKSKSYTPAKGEDYLDDMIKGGVYKPAKGEDYLNDAKSVAKIKMPDVDSNIGIKLENYINKQSKKIKSTSKKVKVEA
jgi:polyhydroxyalkanoate synthesis regulator phasin